MVLNVVSVLVVPLNAPAASKAMGFEPMFRMGEATVDESFDPRTTKWLDAGMKFYPAQKAKRTDQVKLTLHYLRENRVDENETAQGMSMRAQLIW